MADKSTLLRTFNTQFFALFDDILLIFPDNIDIATGRKSFETIKRANPTILIKVWLTHVYTPYRDSINNGDVEYFINKDYGADLTQISNVQEVMRMIDTIREPIRSMNDVNKGHTIKYIQVLSKLSELYSKV